jgi:hypothetical protein
MRVSGRIRRRRAEHHVLVSCQDVMLLMHQRGEIDIVMIQAANCLIFHSSPAEARSHSPSIAWGLHIGIANRLLERLFPSTVAVQVRAAAADVQSVVSFLPPSFNPFTFMLHISMKYEYADPHDGLRHFLPAIKARRTWEMANCRLHVRFRISRKLFWNIDPQACSYPFVAQSLVSRFLEVETALPSGALTAGLYSALHFREQLTCRA